MTTVTVSTGVTQEFTAIETGKWIIHSFSSLPSKVGDFIDSPVMNLHNESWHLRLYPGGKRDTSKNFIPLFFHCASSEKKIETKYKLSLYDHLRNKFKLRVSDSGHMSRDNGRGYDHFYKRTKFIDPEYGYILNDKVIIQVEVQIKKPVEEIWVPSSTFHNDLEDMLEKGVESDIMFIVGEKTYKAHKVFIAIRAPILHSLLDDDSKEFYLPRDKVKEEIFEHILQYIYTEKIDKDFIKQNALEVLNAANYCGVVTLKHIAEIELIQTINVQNAAELILIADSMSCAALKEKAFEYVSLHKSEIVASAGWEKFKESATLLAEIFESSCKNKSESVFDLRKKCQSKGLSTDGTRKMLVERLIESNVK